MICGDAIAQSSSLPMCKYLVSFSFFRLAGTDTSNFHYSKTCSSKVEKAKSDER